MKARTWPLRRTVLLIAGVAIVVCCIAGAAVYRDRVKPFRTTVLEVDGASVRMRYFVNRINADGGAPMAMLQTITKELILRDVATKPPYSFTVTAEEMDRYTREAARAGGEPLSDAELKEWYRQRLNDTRLTDAEYRRLVETRILAVKMSTYLARKIPTVAEQILLNVIPVKDFTDGDAVKTRYEAGADFATLARTYSVSQEMKEKGGRLGWFPRGVLVSAIEGTAFTLAPRQCSPPFSADEKTIVVLMVSARDPARRIDPQSLQVLESRALDKWFEGEYPKHTIRFHGFRDGYDSETNAWVQRQLAKMQMRQTAREGAQGQ